MNQDHPEIWIGKIQKKGREVRFYLLSLYLKLGTWVQLALLTFQPDDAPMHNCTSLLQCWYGCNLPYFPTRGCTIAQLHIPSSMFQTKLCYAYCDLLRLTLFMIMIVWVQLALLTFQPENAQLHFPSSLFQTSHEKIIVDHKSWFLVMLFEQLIAVLVLWIKGSAVIT